MSRKKDFLNLMLLMIITAALVATPIFIIHYIENRDNVSEEDRRRMNLSNKARFGDHMEFDFRIVERNGILSGANLGGAVLRIMNPELIISHPYTNIIFVHTIEESTNFTDDIIVGWPRTNSETGEIDTIFYDALIEGVRRAVDKTEEDLTRTTGIFAGQLIRPAVTLEEFGLTYPLTVEDLVDNWRRLMRCGIRLMVMRYHA